MFWNKKKQENIDFDITDEEVNEIINDLKKEMYDNPTESDILKERLDELSRMYLELEEFTISIYTNYVGLLNYLMEKEIFKPEDLRLWKKKASTFPEIRNLKKIHEYKKDLLLDEESESEDML